MTTTFPDQAKNSDVAEGSDYGGMAVQSLYLSAGEVFPSLSPEVSGPYVEYLNHELEMQRLLLLHPSLHTVLALRASIHTQRVSGYSALTQEEAVALFHQPPP